MNTNKPDRSEPYVATVNVGVLYADGETRDEVVLELVEQGRTDEVFVSCQNRSLVDVFEQAAAIRDQIKSVRSIPEPVVIGPISTDVAERSIVEQHKHLLIRTTTHTYAEYCAWKKSRR